MSSKKQTEEATKQRKTVRENEQQADSAMDVINSSLLDFFKSLLPEWLFSFIFDEDPNAPNESAEDMVPSTAGQKAAAARAVYNSGAVKKWETAKSDYAGGDVVHTSPVAGVSKSSGYGMRMHPIQKVMKMHNGDDLTGGGSIQASAEGTVLFAGWKGGFGNTVIIGHDDGTKTLYGHMTGSKAPKIGESVERGEVIGVMGSTGNSTGTHLHYEQFDKNGRHRKPVIDGVSEAKHAAHEHTEKKEKPRSKMAELAAALDADHGDKPTPDVPKISKIARIAAGSAYRS